MARLSPGLGSLIASAVRSGFTKGVLRLYTSTMPNNPHEAEVGTLLAEITAGGLPFTPGMVTNGLDFDIITYDEVTMKTYLAKAAAQVWQGVGLANGTIGWGRLYANAMIVGETQVGVRLDGNASNLGDSDFTVSTNRVVVGVPVIVSAMRLVINGRKQ